MHGCASAPRLDLALLKLNNGRLQSRRGGKTLIDTVRCSTFVYIFLFLLRAGMFGLNSTNLPNLRPERVSSSPRLELQSIWSPHVGAGN